MRPIYALLCAPIALGILIRFAFPDAFTYSIWSDRDLLRAAQIWDWFPTVGAEINGAFYARVPGGFYYYLLALFQAISEDPTLIYVLLSGAVTAGFIAVYLTARLMFGPLAGLAATGAYALSPGVLSSASQIWNPALTLPLTALIYLLLARVLRGHSWSLPVLFALLVATIQVHMSNLALLAAVLVVLAVMPNGTRLKHWAAAAIAALAVMAPYIAAEAANGWINTKLILGGYDGKLYSAPSFGAFFKTLMQISGGGIPDSRGASNRVLSLFAGLLLLGVAWRIGIALYRCGIGWAPRAWRQRLKGLNQKERAVLSLFIVLVVCGALLTINRNASVYVRYILFLIPAVALLIGAFLEELLVRLGNNQSLAIPVAALFASMFCLQGYIDATRKIAQPNPVAPLEALLDGLRNQTGLGDEGLREKVLVVGDAGKFVFPKAGYLIHISSAPARNGAYDGCILSVAGNDGPAAASKAAAAFGQYGIPAPRLKLLFRTDAWHVFGYAANDGNCLASLISAYDQTPRERIVHEVCKMGAADGLVFSDTGGENGVLRFIVRHTFSPRRICLGLDLRVSEGSITPSLFSPHMKGYTGYPISAYHLSSIKLRFESGDRGLREVDIVDTPLGGQENIRTLPWVGRGIPVEKGTAHLSMVVRLSPQNAKQGAPEEFEAVLMENFPMTPNARP